MLATQKETGREVMVGQVVRLIPEYASIKELQESSIYGKIESATFPHLSPKPAWAWNAGCIRWSGLMALDSQIHNIDYGIHDR